MCISSAVMVMTERLFAICILIRVRVRRVGGGDMHVRVVMISVRVSQGDNRPVSGMSDRMLRLHHPMQVKRRQNDDAQPDAEVANRLRQMKAP